MKQGHPDGGNVFDRVVHGRYTKQLNTKPSFFEHSMMTQVRPFDHIKVIMPIKLYGFAIVGSSDKYHKWISYHLDGAFQNIKHECLIKRYMGANVE